ncbi:MAG: hypothetical protein ACLF0G_15340 [Candidatus Brocadiia bacterium]
MTARYLAPLSALLALAAPTEAKDFLRYARGGGVQGTLKQLTFLEKDFNRMCLRSQVRSIAIADDEGEKDAVELKDGTRLEGRVVAVTFQTSKGMMSVARNRIAAIEIDPEWNAQKARDEAQKKQEEADEAEEPEEKLPPELKEALETNASLCRACLEKAKDLEKAEKRAIKSKYAGDVLDVDREIRALNRRIAEKRHRLRTEDLSDSRERIYRERIAGDLRARDRARHKLEELRKKVAEERQKVERAAEERENRVKAVYSEHKRALHAGSGVSADQMHDNYKAALADRIDDRRGKRSKDRD